MRADNRSHLLAAAAQRSQATADRTRDALRRLDRSGTPVTFASVAHAAGVSRSWLYRQPDLRSEIDRLRSPNRPTAPVPAGQRGSAASLQRRVEDLLDTNRLLRQENQRLREQVAGLLGEQRATAGFRSSSHIGSVR